MAKRLSRDWEHVYAHRVYCLESFVDPQRFQRTCYRAANRLFLGRTTGRGQADHTKKPNRSRKEVLGYTLTKNPAPAQAIKPSLAYRIEPKRPR
jgi:hypothetical protein